MIRRRVSSAFGLILFLGAAAWCAPDSNPPSIRSNRGAWPIRRQWTVPETHHYAAWVENLFRLKTQGTVEQRIAKLERMLTDPEMNLLENPDFLGSGSNPQLPLSIIREMHNMLDCARFTAVLPAYYAYRRALPWMVTCVHPPEGEEIRTASYNIPVAWACSLDYSSLRQFFYDSILAFSSGNYRVNLNGPKADQADTVPVAIAPEFLLPGCINYVDGHCLVLANVSDYGELQFLNASTTNTRDIFTYNGMNTVSGITPRGESSEDEWAGCYQGLRVLRYPIAETDSRGNVVRVRRRTDEEMKEFGFSVEQYTLMAEMAEKHFITEGRLKPQSFHDLIRLRMKRVNRIAPLKFMEDYANELLQMWQFREDFVQAAWRDYLQNGPITYPAECEDENIFQALGRWETWSSPSSDVDRRNKYFYLADWLDYAIRWYGMTPESVDFKGLEKYTIKTQEDLARALLKEKNRLFAERVMRYTNSKGGSVALSLLDIEQRLYDLSFDPNHPPELRWGAPIGSAERASAPNTFTPLPGGTRVPMEEAYRLEAFYRSLCQRETDMSYLLGMFTTGYPVRDRFDEQLSKWLPLDERTYASDPTYQERVRQRLGDTAGKTP